MLSGHYYKLVTTKLLNHIIYTDVSTFTYSIIVSYNVRFLVQLKHIFYTRVFTPSILCMQYIYASLFSLGDVIVALYKYYYNIDTCK